ncbi:DNA internalization-related competence protein ComEC/Rec2 [Shewanella glacialimarina]|uniref:DNA internalization-related competence protein ComEC/Rec2 n=1 Tax=Shewanella glacialimarina TaxID=2590884 RepID=UPI001CF83A18|nr:DNA internalization-related competence protein ComEC/Rec2 [Shewanella glacialimarina]UCX04611.1 DNA internalization-related competence protein ComEC/Rec2 [Shewanella glacialimarina]
MNRFIFGFCISSLIGLLWPVIPSLWCLPIWLLLALVCLFKTPRLSGAFFAVFWISIYFYSLDFQPEVTPKTNKTFTAEIVSLVNHNRDWISLDVRVIEPKLTNINIFGLFKTITGDQIYRLTWQQAPKVELGQIWQFDSKLKPITSIANQGGFNQQRYYINRHIVAKGRVKQADLLSYQPSLRQRWLTEFAAITPKITNGDLLLALLFGDKSQISDQRWQQLRQTGTGHLIAISGLHLSVVFGLVFGLFFVILTRVKLAQIVMGKVNLQYGMFAVYLALTVAALSALGYAYLAGFAVATQRALFMLIFLVLFSVLKQHYSVWQRLMYALAGVLFIDPLSMLSAGFWLSFIALAIILRFVDTSVSHAKKVSTDHHWRQKVTGYIGSLWSIQWRLALGLGLLQALLFGTLSIHSIWINLIVVPWFSLLVIPIVLGSFLVWMMLSPLIHSSALVSLFQFSSANELSFDSVLFIVADKLLVPFSQLLTWSSDFSHNVVYVSESWVVAGIFSLLGWTLLLTFRWSFSRLLTHSFNGMKSIFNKHSQSTQMAKIDHHAIILLVALVMNLPLMQLAISKMLQMGNTGDQRLAFNLSGPIYLHVLDVAQGSAIVLQQQHRAIIYDTGAAFGDFSYAERAILPFLQARGITQLDYIVISHHDNDHSGGVMPILTAFPNAQLIADNSKALINQAADLADINVSDCNPVSWHWGSVQISILADHLGSDKDNNQSCVMMLHIEFENDHLQTVEQGADHPGKGDRKSILPHESTTKAFAVLLTGDIEAQREQSLISNKQQIDADIVFVPHHGSRTSSTDQFIDAVSPQLAIVNAGFNNQYGFPKSEVMARYQQRDINTLITGEQGQISIKFQHAGYKASTYRNDLAPFWYNRLFRFGQIVKAE